MEPAPVRSASSGEHLDRDDVRVARLLSVLSVAWTITAGCGAIVLGVREPSAALVAFGAVGFVDAAGSASLAYQFHHGLRHDALAAHLEAASHRVVAVGLLTVGLASVTLGGVRLVRADESGSSWIGTALAGAALAVLLGLALGKVRVATRVRSGALRSDGHLSAVGAAEAAVTLVGAVTSSWGFGWADALAAIAVGSVAAVVGARSMASRG